MAKKKLIINIVGNRISDSSALELASIMQKFYSTPGKLEAMEKWRAARKEGMANGKEQMLSVQ